MDIKLGSDYSNHRRVSANYRNKVSLPKIQIGKPVSSLAKPLPDELLQDVYDKNSFIAPLKLCWAPDAWKARGWAERAGDRDGASTAGEEQISSSLLKLSSVKSCKVYLALFDIH